jgi:hypothetical protein
MKIYYNIIICLGVLLMCIFILQDVITQRNNTKKLLTAYDTYNKNVEIVLDSIAEGYDLFGIEVESEYYQNYIKSREHLDSLIRENNYKIKKIKKTIILHKYNIN